MQSRGLRTAEAHHGSHAIPQASSEWCVRKESGRNIENKWGEPFRASFRPQRVPNANRAAPPSGRIHEAGRETVAKCRDAPKTPPMAFATLSSPLPRDPERLGAHWTQALRFQ